MQVESLAQLGVQLLLFGLGLELSPSKLRAVWDVAVMGERAAAAHGLEGGLGLLVGCPARAFMISREPGLLIARRRPSYALAEGLVCGIYSVVRGGQAGLEAGSLQ